MSDEHSLSQWHNGIRSIHAAEWMIFHVRRLLACNLRLVCGPQSHKALAVSLIVSHDGESYDFIKQLSIEYIRDREQPPEISTEGLDITTDLEFFTDYFFTFHPLLLVAVTLIKFRVLQDLHSFPIIREVVGPKVPQELLDMILIESMSSDMGKRLRRRFLTTEENAMLIAALEDQIWRIFVKVPLGNWTQILRGEEVVQDDKGPFKLITCIREAWRITPGAFDYFRNLLDESERNPTEDHIVLDRRSKARGLAVDRVPVDLKKTLLKWILFLLSYEN